LIAVYQQNEVKMAQGATGNVIAGLGQLIQGRLLAAIVYFILNILLWFVLLGWIVNIIAALDAALWKK
jgi:TM2 domain-containing membrane protein YozV